MEDAQSWLKLIKRKHNSSTEASGMITFVVRGDQMNQRSWEQFKNGEKKIRNG
jgi:hypothetical protein